MQQIIQFDNELRDKIKSFEMGSERISQELMRKYKADFEAFGQRIVIELIRIQNGQSAHNIDMFEDDYESFIEVGIENGTEYYPNGYIPIWKVKTEWFQKVGYLTDHDEAEIEFIVLSLVQEMLEEGNF